MAIAEQTSAFILEEAGLGNKVPITTFMFVEVHQIKFGRLQLLA